MSAGTEPHATGSSRRPQGQRAKAMGWTRQPNGIDLLKWCADVTNSQKGMKTTTIDIDLAKNGFQVHGVASNGKVVLRRQLKREHMVTFFANVALIGMEACGRAYDRARKLQPMGHTVRLMARQFVKPYVKIHKHGAADAEAICEAIVRPNKRALF
ncbi:hypothetical protein LMG23994_04524 [Cupriavidus pinatubonensis]|uniref:Transposase n=1 Tax=Cupriavidus pinatubonensis TaxID=248026 RepID=A0ABM8XL30_9BURK|nr:hypothetical protein LMG23994_04524 [Cupriavidus pinatubonensis]